MKLYAKLERSALCESRWERHVMRWLESSARDRILRWGMAVVATLLWVFLSKPFPWPAAMLCVIAWSHLWMHYTAGTILRILDRTTGAEIEARADDQL